MKRIFIPTLAFLSLCFAEAQSFRSVIQKGHGEAVKTARFIRNGEYLLTTSRDKTAKLWDAESGMEMRSFLGHEHTVNDFDVVENHMATSSADQTVIVWDILSGDMVWKSGKFDGYVTDVAYNPKGDMLAVGSYEDSISIFETKGFSLIRKIRANPDKGIGYGVSVKFSPDGSYLSIGQDNRLATVYSTKNWSKKFELKPESGYCGGCGTLTAFDQKAKYLLKLSNGATLAKYELESGKLEWQTNQKVDDISSIEVNDADTHFVVSTEDSVFMYDNISNKLLTKWSVSGKISDASFHPNGESIILAVDKVSIRFDLKGNELQRYYGIINESSTGLDYDLGSYWEHHIAKWVKYKPARLLDGNSFFIGKTATKARKWNVKSGLPEMEYIGHQKGVLCFEKITEDLIASGGADGRIVVWNKKTGEIVKEIKAHREPIFDLSLSHNGEFLASAGWDGVISIWKTENWERYNYTYNEGNSAYNIAFTANDAYLVVGLLDKTLRLLEIETKKFVREFVGHTDVVTSIEVDDGEIVTAGWDGQIMVWDLYSGLIKRKFRLDQPCFAAKRAKDGILTAGASGVVSVWDETGKKMRDLGRHSAEINGLQLSGNLLSSTDVDGVTKFWNLSKDKEIFEHIQMGKNDWMVKTPEGYFDATDQAISNIHFVKDLEAFSSAQLLDEFYRPGLIRELFADTRTGRTNIQKHIGNSPPPEVKLSGISGENNVAKLFLKIQDAGGGVEDIKLFHNGKRLAFQSNVLKTRKADDKTNIYTLQFPMVAGVNEFSASASSKSKIESARSAFSLISDSKVPGSICHILAVGINEYENESLNLNYAKPDASSFASQMKTQSSSIYSEVVLHQLFDKEATKDGILKKIDKLKSEISSNDVFIFYYAGHGSMVDNDFYLVSSNASRLYDNQKMTTFGIKATVLQEAMLEIKALKQLIIMDACQSGGSVEVLAQRGAPEEKAIAQLSRSSGIHVMASAGSDQYATEFESLGHGLFTYLLLKGLGGEADGAPKDGKVTIYELKSYLDDQVPELSIKYKGSPQYPHTFSRGQDFPIVIVK